MSDYQKDAAALHELFGGKTLVSHTREMLPPDADGKVRPKKVLDKRPVRATVEWWEKHCDPEGDIGIGLLQDKEQCRYIAIDTDAYQDEVDFTSVVQQVARDKMPLSPVRSKSGGMHLLLFSEPASEELLKSAATALAARLGLKTKRAGGQTEFVCASTLWMPYMGGSGRVGIKKNGLEMLVSEFVRHAKAKKVTRQQLENIVAAPQETARPSARQGAAYAAVVLERSERVLSSMENGDGRNDYLNNTVHLLGSMIEAGWIDEKVVVDRMRAAAQAAGMDMVKVEDMFTRGSGPLAQGKREPPPTIPARETQVYRPHIVRVADVAPRSVRWLWPGRIALGKLCMIGGHPGVSKSTLLCALIARITRGGRWPCCEAQAPIGNVILLNNEDDVADTIRPRLAAAGADVERVHILRGMVREDGVGRRGFDLMQDVAQLETAIRTIGDVILVGVDPMTAYMGRPGKLDSHRATDVRSMLEPVQELSASSGAAFIGVNHLTKGGSNEALMRFLGSIAFVGAARSGWLVAKDRENARRRLFPARKEQHRR